MFLKKILTIRTFQLIIQHQSMIGKLHSTYSGNCSPEFGLAVSSAEHPAHEHHKKAAEHHLEAAKHHEQAAAHYAEGG